jgi:hypothetical protein
MINGRPHSFLPNGMTPIEAFWKRKPGLAHLRVFGCDAQAIIPSTIRKAQDPHAQRRIFVGCSYIKKAYQLWNPIQCKLIESRDVKVCEKSFTFWRHNKIDDFVQSSNIVPRQEMDYRPITESGEIRRPNNETDRTTIFSTPDDKSDERMSSSEADDYMDPNFIEEAESNRSSANVHGPRRSTLYPRRHWWNDPRANAASVSGDQEINDTIAHAHFVSCLINLDKSESMESLTRPLLDGILALDVR